MKETELWDQFNRLCRGEQLRTPDMDRGLKCFYLHYFDPYLQLGPFKLEPRNEKPYLAIFRDFFYDDEMREYIDQVTPQMERSMHLTKDFKPGEKTYSR